jgi:hypothetical protein
MRWNIKAVPVDRLKIRGPLPVKVRSGRGGHKNLDFRPKDIPYFNGLDVLDSKNRIVGTTYNARAEGDTILVDVK